MGRQVSLPGRVSTSTAPHGTAGGPCVHDTAVGRGHGAHLKPPTLCLGSTVMASCRVQVPSPKLSLYSDVFPLSRGKL